MELKGEGEDLVAKLGSGLLRLIPSVVVRTRQQERGSPGRGPALAAMRSLRLGMAIAWAVCVACTGDVGFTVPSSDSDVRGGLTLQVGMAPEGAAVAEALGWGSGVPGAEVRVHRLGTEFAWETGVTDQYGTARLPRLVPGQYRIAVYKALSESDAAIAGVRALAGGFLGRVAASGTERTIGLVPNQPGSLVISEIFAHDYAEFMLASRHYYYVELHNNSDQIVFLDGLTFGTTSGVPTTETLSETCEASAFRRHDPDGVWASFLHRFPGEGGEYPLMPRTTAVVALDAIDHSAFHPLLPDLSGADFELLGHSDVDNPDVPNAVEIGILPWHHGHGVNLRVLGDALFVAKWVDPDVLPRYVSVTPAGEYEYLRVPTDRLIDVVWAEMSWPWAEQQVVFCDGPVHPRFDQLGGGYIVHHEDGAVSMQRIGLPGGSDGRLQDTNVSAVDLTKAPITPGRIR